MGVMAATYAMRHLQAEYAAAGDLHATVERNNCLSDGIQWVTGCTSGNGALTCNNLGETAFTLLSLKNGKSIRICSRHTSSETIENITGGKTVHDKAFGTLNIPFDSLFTINEAQTTNMYVNNVNDRKY
jgi:formylmethanofuran dehydrogenase subunit E